MMQWTTLMMTTTTTSPARRLTTGRRLLGLKNNDVPVFILNIVIVIKDTVITDAVIKDDVITDAVIKIVVIFSWHEDREGGGVRRRRGEATEVEGGREEKTEEEETEEQTEEQTEGERWRTRIQF